MVNEPAEILANLTLTDVSCNGQNNGAASVSPTGGTGAGVYTIVWFNGSIGTSVSGLSAGTYSVAITDGNGCTTTSSPISFTISGPSQISTTTSTTDVSCYGYCDGTATVSPSGGTPPYSFFWNNGQQTQTTTGLCSGSYTCIITDGNGCMVQEVIIITQPASLLSVSVDSTDETSALNDGSATAIVLAGTPPYTYAWSNGGTTNPQINLAPGVYTVDVTDSWGCTISDATSVNAYIPTGIINIKNTSKNLLKVTDVLGQETPYRKNTSLFYIYDDGTVEKRIIIE